MVLPSLSGGWQRGAQHGHNAVTRLHRLVELITVGILLQVRGVARCDSGGCIERIGVACAGLHHHSHIQLMLQLFVRPQFTAHDDEIGRIYTGIG